ncbi:hypothetical protein [Sodalis sp. RH16]|uniref:hypothetical protein n=1 Tax=Sodalis sp. RH16 TaxID=3394331 RepID=UPI0039B6B688
MIHYDSIDSLAMRPEGGLPGVTSGEIMSQEVKWGDLFDSNLTEFNFFADRSAVKNPCNPDGTLHDKRALAALSQCIFVSSHQ